MFYGSLTYFFLGCLLTLFSEFAIPRRLSSKADALRT